MRELAWRRHSTTRCYCASVAPTAGTSSCATGQTVVSLGKAVLDPTCGSGAFLFAALNILELLYEAGLERMEAFVEDLERSGVKHRPEKFADTEHLPICDAD